MARTAVTLLSIALTQLFLSQSLPAQAPLDRLTREVRRATPAPEGTEAERARLSAIEEFLTPYDVSLERAEVSTGPRTHTFAEYLIAHPQEMRRSTLTLLVPADAPAASIRVGALMAARGAGRDGAVPVVFLGGARREEVGAAFMSARLSGIPGRRHVAALSFERVERGMLVEAGTSGDVAPFHMLQALRAVSSEELRFGINGNRLQLARLGLSVPEEPVSALLSRGLPAVQLTNLRPGDVTGRVSRLFFDDEFVAEEERLVEALFSLAEELPLEAEWERNYATLQAGPLYLLLGERTLLLVGGALLMGMLLYSVMRPRRVRRYRRIMRRNAWQLPLLYGAVAAYLFLATTVIDFISQARNFPSLWTYAPTVTFAAKLLLAVTLFGLSHEALRKAVFSQNSSFYSGWSLLLQLLALMVLLAVNLALSFYFIWTFLLTFLFGYVRYPALKRAIFLLSLLPPVLFVFTVLERGETVIAELLISSPTNATLLISLFLLPYLLMLFRLDLLHRTPKGKRVARRTFFRRLATASLGVLGLLVLLFYDPFSDEVPVPVTVRELIEDPHSLTVSAPRPVAGTAVRLDGVQLFQWDEGVRHHTAAIPGRPEVFELALARRAFLGRTHLSYTITAPIPLRRLEVALVDVPGLTVYESSFPVVEENDGPTLVIGENPPNPLELELVVAGSAAPSLRVDATMPRAISDIGIAAPEAVSISATTRFRARLQPPGVGDREE